MDFTSLFKNISTFIFDIDGVLTDGTILVLENGLQARRMSIKDGYALQLAVKKGYRVIVLSGATSVPAEDRLQKLGITQIYMGVKDKRSFIEKFASGHQLGASELLFMGDDVPDVSALRFVGLPACPSDAVEEVKAVVKYVSPFAGGQGCVRDVLEKVMKLNDRWHHEEDVASK